MKRILFIFFIFLILFSLPAFSTELTTGLTYDSHPGTFPVGTDFSLKEEFEDNSSLTAGLAYKNAGAYTASFSYTKVLSLFLLSGGLNYDIKTSGISQNLSCGAGIVFTDFSVIASGSLRINPENIFSPDSYSCSADLILDTKESIIDLKCQYSSQARGNGKTEKIGGGFVFTAYEEGAPADIDIITNVCYLKNPVDNLYGLITSAGMGINVYLPFMTLRVKGVADITDPEYTGHDIPYTLSLSTSFKF